MDQVRKGAWWAFRILITIFFVAVVAEFVLAGLGLFRAMPSDNQPVSHPTFDEKFNVHAGLGWTLSGVSLLLLIAILIAWTGSRSIIATIAMAVLTLVQPSLASAGEDTPAVGAFHVMNALLILGVSGFLAAWAWRRSVLVPPEQLEAPAAPPRGARRARPFSPQ